MKYRKIIESGILTAAIIISPFAGTAAFAQSASIEGSDQAYEEVIKEDDTKEAEDADGDAEASETESTESEETSVWDGMLLANVSENSYLNIREEASEDSDVVGKLYYGAGASVVEKGDEWTKVSSGNVEGYVKNEYCVFDEEAGELAEEICDTVAVTTTGSVRLRKAAGTDSKVITLIAADTELIVDEDAQETEGWVAVEYSGETAYISADYVEIELDIDEAISIEEEQAQKAAAAASSSSSSSVSTTQGSAVSSSVDDVTLLAALIQCEAGGESYEGKLAVGAVVVNRVKSSSYPSSIYGVIYQSGQFSPASSGKLASVISSGSISSSCYEAAKAAISGTDNTGGATSFKPGKSSSGTVIGNQTFY